MNTKKLGSVNPCNLCSLMDADGRVIGYTLDTPNCIAFAMATNEKVTKAVAHYSMFGDSVTSRNDVKDRFWFVVKEGAIHSEFLRWL